MMDASIVSGIMILESLGMLLFLLACRAVYVSGLVFAGCNRLTVET